MTDTGTGDTVDRDTVDLMVALLLVAGADMIEPGTAVHALTDEASPFVDVDTLVMRAAVECIKVVAQMGDVTVDDLAAFTQAITDHLNYQQGEEG